MVSNTDDPIAMGPYTKPPKAKTKVNKAAPSPMRTKRQAKLNSCDKIKSHRDKHTQRQQKEGAGA